MASLAGLAFSPQPSSLEAMERIFSRCRAALDDAAITDWCPVCAGSLIERAARSAQSQRAKAGMNAHRVYSQPVDLASGNICDRHILLNDDCSVKNYRSHLRCMRFKDPEAGKTLIFPTKIRRRLPLDRPNAAKC